MAAALPGALDFAALKKSFVKLMNQADPNCLPAFILWLDLKVAQFKINGCMYADTVHEETWITYAKDVLKKINNSGGQYSLPAIPGLPFPPAMSAIYGQVPPIPPPYEPSSRTDYSAVTSSPAKYNYNDDNAPLSLVMKKKKRQAQMQAAVSSAAAAVSLPIPDQMGVHGIYSHANMQPSDSVPFVNSSHYTSPPPPLSSSGFDLRVPPRKRVHKDSTGSRESSVSHTSTQEELDDNGLAKRLTTLRSLLAEPPKTGAEAEACDLSSKPVAAVSSEAFPGVLPVLPVPMEEVHCPSDASACDSPGHNAYDVQKSNTKEALKIVLTKKQGKRQKQRKHEENVPPAGNGLDLTTPWTLPSSDVESSPSKAKKDGSPKTTNVCPICFRTFDYRSSFRRHMRIHEGVYSHQCAVCGRKFTRKEHFDRHKCSRRPNKPSRSADGNVESSPEKRIKVAYPPLSAMEGLANQPSEATFKQESMLEDSMYFVKEERAPSHEQSAAEDSTDEKGSLTGESRRKKSIPRKAISEQDEEDLEAYYRHQSPHSEDLESHDSPANSEPLDRPDLAPLPVEDEEAFEENHRDLSSLSLENLSRLANKADIPDRLREYIEMSPTHSMSEEDNMSDPGTPSTCMDDEFTLDTGNYKVSAEEALPHDAAIETNSRGRFIKVTKQGKYLKLKREVQLIDGHLCFVCPNCSKVFHRSSNFSRHMRIHRGVYSYLCPTCHRGFFRKEHFQKHKCHRKSMSHIWDRKTKLDMVLKPKTNSTGEDDEEEEEEEEEEVVAADVETEEDGCLYIDENPSAEA